VFVCDVAALNMFWYNSGRNLFKLLMAETCQPCFMVYCQIFSKRELTFAICYRPSVCLLSLTFVRHTQVVQIFINISMALGTLAIH